MYLNDRISIFKTHFSLYFVILFVLCTIGLGLMPKAYAFETNSVDIDDSLNVQLQQGSNENLFFHFTINGEPLTWNYFEQNKQLLVKIPSSLRFLTYIHTDSEYIARDIEPTYDGSNYRLVINWDMLSKYSNELNNDTLNEPVRFMIKSTGSSKTFNVTVEGYQKPKSIIFRTIELASAMLIDIVDSIFTVITSNPLLLIVYTLALVALMFWVFTVFRV